MIGEKIFDSPFVAFDNSDHSLMVLDIIDTMKVSLPKVNIVHVHKPKKSYIFPSKKGPQIYKLLKDRYPDANNPNINVELKQYGDKGTNLVLLQNFIAKQSSILFLGFAGSKGRKHRSCDLSSRIRQFVYQSKFNLAIVKRPNPELNKISFEGLINVIEFCKRFNKELTVLHTFNSDLKKYSKHIKLGLRGIQEERMDFKFEQLFEEKPLIEAVKQKENGYDWIVMNKNGYRGSINKQRFVGSNTSRVIEEVETNLIIFA